MRISTTATTQVAPAFPPRCSPRLHDRESPPAHAGPRVRMRASTLDSDGQSDHQKNSRIAEHCPRTMVCRTHSLNARAIRAQQHAAVKHQPRHGTLNASEDGEDRSGAEPPDVGSSARQASDPRLCGAMLPSSRVDQIACPRSSPGADRRSVERPRRRGLSAGRNEPQPRHFRELR